MPHNATFKDMCVCVCVRVCACVCVFARVRVWACTQQARNGKRAFLKLRNMHIKPNRRDTLQPTQYGQRNCHGPELGRSRLWSSPE